MAIKVISLEATTPKEVEFMREGLFREARSAGGLSHPGIVIIYDVGQENDAAFIAMERVEGPTLQKMLDDGGMADPKLALDILRQAAAALDYAHQNGVVHRDIKPANIMLHKGTTVKVTDFGIAKLAAGQNPQQTLTGMVVGTPAYMSPDQIEMRPLDGRSDQFSLAVVAYEILTGTKPFEGSLLGPLMHMIVYGTRPSASGANAALPAAVDAVLERAMRRFPEERYRTCTEFVAALEACFPVRAQTGQVVPPSNFRDDPTRPIDNRPLVDNLPHNDNGGKRGKNLLPAVLASCGALALAGGFLLYRLFAPPHVDPNHRVTPPLVVTPPPVTPPPIKIGAAPVVAQFTAVPPAIQAGGPATLRWDVKGATEITIDPDVGNVGANGSFEVRPVAPTTYLLVAKGTGGTVTASVAVGVTAVTPKPPPGSLPPTAPPRIPVFRADPASLKRGERFQLIWTVDRASQVVIDHGVGQVPASGSRSVLADATTTYTLTASGGGGTTTGQTTVTVGVETASEIYDEGVAAQRAQQPSKAFTLFQLAANRGEPRAMLEVGKMYRSGEGVARDVGQSVAWFQKAADAGNASAMDYMGAMYRMGEGVPKDDRQAFSWYSKAAAAGNSVGMDALGQMYRNGWGVPQNYTEAVRWFGKAAGAGNASGMYHLGMMYENGWGVNRSPSDAMDYYRRAAAGGEREAVQKLADLQRQPAQPAGRSAPSRVTVRADQPWTDTGIDLKMGDQVTVIANGVVQLSSNERLARVSPAGLMANCGAAASLYGRPAGAFPAPNLPCWSLLGRIGTGRMLMEIGTSATFAAAAGGRLYLGPNDDSFGDNSGSWIAVITVTSGR